MLEIILAAPRGYCAGVHRAIEIVDKAIKEYGSPLYINHEIIHNKFIMESFKKRGVIFDEPINNIPTDSIIIFSAHGVGPEYIKKVKEKKLRFINASCPLVTKVHNKAQSFLSKGYNIIYIGQKGHQEALGILEEGRERIHLVETYADILNLNIQKNQWEKVALLNQTTLSVNDTKELIEKIKKEIPNIELPKISDICYATTNRQNAVTELCKSVDVLLIVGSKNSSNSTKLVNIGTQHNIPSYLIDSDKDIKKEKLQKILDKIKNPKIGVSAGASAPELYINKVVQFLENNWEQTKVSQLSIVEEKIFFDSNITIGK